MVNIGDIRRYVGRSCLVIALSMPLVLAFVLVAAEGCEGGSSSDNGAVAGTPVRLTGIKARGWDPAWSPDGTRIAFVCAGSNRRLLSGEVMNRPISPAIAITANICVMNADGSGRERLTDEQGDDFDPTWSPDGSMVAFWSTRRGPHGLYVIHTNGSGIRGITSGQSWDIEPAWSPDGSKIAFSSDRGQGYYGIFIVNVDDSEIIKVTRTSRWGESEPSWSPDGTQIAYTSRRRYERSAILVGNVDGSGERLVHTSSGWPRSPAWSPDGRRIAFVSDVGVDGSENLEIFVVNVDGTGLTRLTNRPNRDSDPAWSPDGRRIVFTSDDSEVYVMDVGR